MSIRVQFTARPGRWQEYQVSLRKAFARAGLKVDLSRDHDPAQVDYMVFAPQSGQEIDFRQFSRLRAVLGLWAGVEQIVKNSTLNVPLTRMVDAGLREGMVEWVTGHVLRYHLGMDQQISCQDGVWAPKIPPLARDRRVGILGLGELGSACAAALRGLNFQVSGWSRSQKSISGVTCHSGEAGLRDLLQGSEILVLLLPLTAATTDLMDASALAMLPAGARLLNPGRGGLIDDDALLAALHTGHLAHATLDVFRSEPLPAKHAFWQHPRVTVTPHIASETRAGTASEVIAENIRRNETGEPMLYVVNRSAGY